MASMMYRVLVLAIFVILNQQQAANAWGEVSGFGDKIFNGYGNSGGGYSGGSQLVGYGVGSTDTYVANGGKLPTTPTTPTAPTTPTTPTTPGKGTGNGGTTGGGGGTGSGGGTLAGTFNTVRGGQATVAQPQTTTVTGGTTGGVSGGGATAGGRGDPIMTGFDGRPFEFIGQPNTLYSLISERHHKVSAKLKLGVMWDHNGTYMEGIGFQYRDHQVTVEIAENDTLAVSVDGEALVMEVFENEVEVIPYVEHGEMLVLWQLHREGLGNAVTITTELLEMVVWLTPAGTEDEGGVKQPAYLNFDTALLSPPHGNQMHGIVGETYNRMLEGDAINDPSHPLFLADDFNFQGKGREHHYAVDSYFGEHHYSLFGKDATEQQQQPAEHKRLLAEDEAALAFPLRASGRAAWSQLALLHRQVSMHASGGRKGLF
ncbi:hypothetical protein COCOBI_10-5080 [Coccomyxa sp. Obi]|nr:hypothetical protein COCOBI_10-5080 [Coccomyxa sp. Obi]